MNLPYVVELDGMKGFTFENQYRLLQPLESSAKYQGSFATI
jgi:hypothetical protein